MDESNATCGKRLDSIGVENTEGMVLLGVWGYTFPAVYTPPLPPTHPIDNRRAYRELLVTTPGLGKYISGAILFEETLYQKASTGKTMVEHLQENDIVPGIKVDKGLAPLVNSNNESWTQGLDGLAQRTAEYYKAGARFAKWRAVISIPDGPSRQAVFEAAYGLARYGAISQASGLVPIIEPEVLLDGEHDIDRTLEVASWVWAETFKCMADQGLLFEGMLLKPAMVTPGAESTQKTSAGQVADYTLKYVWGVVVVWWGCLSVV